MTQPARKIRYSVAMSLDGFIAGPEGEYDWILIDPEIDFNEIYDQFDTILMGRGTFEPMIGQEGPSMQGIKTYVLSTTLKQSEHPDVTIVNENVPEFLSELKQQPGKDIWLFGGGKLFRSLAELGFVDGVDVAIIPIILGDGIRFVPAPSKTLKLELANHSVLKTTGTVCLEYRVSNV